MPSPDELQEFKDNVKKMTAGLAPGEYIRFCEEMEYFFQEEGERTLEGLDQEELGVLPERTSRKARNVSP